MINNEHSFILDTDFEREYKLGTCYMCGNKCHESLYADHNCVVNMFFKLKKILKAMDNKSSKPKENQNNYIEVLF